MKSRFTNIHAEVRMKRLDLRLAFSAVESSSSDAK
jgi:hypothetical protein